MKSQNSKFTQSVIPRIGPAGFLKIIAQRYLNFDFCILHFEFKRGFTLIEVIVSLAVLMAALAGPVTLVAQSFFTVQFSKNKLIAAYLAEEGLELIRAVRENNKICQAMGGSMTWGGSGTNPPELRNGSGWRADAININSVACGGATLAYPTLLTPCNLNNPSHRLQQNSEGKYGYFGSGDTIFTRCIDVIRPTADEVLPTGSIIPKEDILDVVSTVQWQERGRIKTFELRERLYNWE